MAVPAIEGSLSIPGASTSGDVLCACLGGESSKNTGLTYVGRSGGVSGEGERDGLCGVAESIRQYEVQEGILLGRTTERKCDCAVIIKPVSLLQSFFKAVMS